MYATGPRSGPGGGGRSRLSRALLGGAAAAVTAGAVAAFGWLFAGAPGGEPGTTSFLIASP